MISASIAEIRRLAQQSTLLTQTMSEIGDSENLLVSIDFR